MVNVRHMKLLRNCNDWSLNTSQGVDTASSWWNSLICKTRSSGMEFSDYPGFRFRCFLNCPFGFKKLSCCLYSIISMFQLFNESWMMPSVFKGSSSVSFKITSFFSKPLFFRYIVTLVNNPKIFIKTYMPAYFRNVLNLTSSVFLNAN